MFTKLVREWGSVFSPLQVSFLDPHFLPGWKTERAPQIAEKVKCSTSNMQGIDTR